MPEAFYIPDGDRFISTGWTIGPWDPGSQHAGPPAALVANEIEKLDPGDQMRVARFTFEILRPIPVAPLRIETRIARPGKRVQLAEARLLLDDETEIARASAWRIRTSGDSVPATPNEPRPFVGPNEASTLPVFDPGTEKSYFAAMEWRGAGGSFFEPGPATVWMRMRHQLVAGEDPTPLSRVLAAADSGNGISMVVPLGEFLFINTELSVHLTRGPISDWVCLDATTRIDADGVGHASSILWDERGRIGVGNQALVVAAR